MCSRNGAIGGITRNGGVARSTKREGLSPRALHFGNPLWDCVLRILNYVIVFMMAAYVGVNKYAHVLMTGGNRVLMTKMIPSVFRSFRFEKAHHLLKQILTLSSYTLFINYLINIRRSRRKGSKQPSTPPYLRGVYRHSTFPSASHSKFHVYTSNPLWS